MIKSIADIFEKYGIEIYGFCDFLTLNNKLLECAAKNRLPVNSSTVITFLFPYKVKDETPLNISRYGAVEDYHNVCGEILKNIVFDLKKSFENEQFVYFIDNSPIPEVFAAASCGLGVIGENNLLINKRFGSYVFIGEIVTSLKIQTVENNITYCIKCNRCIDACPTGYLRDKNKTCLSKITQQKKPLSDDEKELIRKSGYVWGCDECQRVCPLNDNKEKTNIKRFIEGYRHKYEIGEDIKNRAYEWRGEKVILRNAGILENKSQV